METIGVALAVPGLIDVLIRGGVFLVERVDSYRNIDQTLDLYRQLGVDISSGILWYRLDALRQASRNSSIPANFSERLKSLLHEAEKALKEIQAKLNEIQVDSRTGKAKYVFWRERGLRKSYESFKAVLDELDRVCSQLHELQIGTPSSFLRSDYFKLVHEDLDYQPGTYLPVSDIFLAKGNYQADGHRVAADFVVERKYRENDIRLLCNKFMDGNLSQGNLKCLGYRQPPYNESKPPYRPYYQMVFELPDCPRCSLAYMIDYKPLIPIRERVELGKKICLAAQLFRESGLIHKALRPRIILLLGDQSTGNDAEKVFLQDLTYVRETSGATSQRGDDDSWQRRIYQHPERQGGLGSYPEVAYEAKHELYSLGVTLLELFLWIPLIERIDRSALDSPVRICQDFETTALSIAEAEGGLPQRYAGDTVKLTLRPASTRLVWLRLASGKLASLNDALSIIVRTCIEGGFSGPKEVLEALEGVQLPQS